MNTRRYFPALAAILGLGSASSAVAALTADLQAPFSVTLKLTTDSAIKDRLVAGGHEYSNKFEAIRFTARDLLAALIANGDIVGPLSGWRIVGRTTTDSIYGVSHRLFAVKNGQPDYALDDEDATVIDFDLPYSVASFRTRVRDEALVSGASTVRFSVEGSFDSTIAPIDLAGLGTLVYAYKTVKLGQATDLLPVPSSIKLNLTGGAVHNAGQETAVYIVEGAMTFGAHQFTAVRVVPPAP